MTPEAIEWLYRTVTGGDPRQLQFEFALWTLAIIRTALIKFQGITLSKSSICRLLAQLGLTPQVPVYRSYRRNPAKVRYYLKTRYPKLAAWAQANGAAIFFADESRVRADGHRGTTWAPCGETPVVEDSGDRFGINMISAVRARGDMFFRSFEGTMNSGRFIEFLKDLRCDAGQPILVIVDKGSYHTSGEVRKFLKEEGEQRGIRLEYLPPYSPELNPDEQVWNQAKSTLGRLCVATKKDLREAVERVLKGIEDSVDLVRSFFRMESTRYANSEA
jgi:transposase